MRGGGGVRGSDPFTSHLAAGLVKVTELELQCLRVIVLVWPLGLISYEIAARLNIDDGSITNRIKSLESKGLVYRPGDTRKHLSPCRVIYATEAGRRYIEAVDNPDVDGVKMSQSVRDPWAREAVKRIEEYYANNPPARWYDYAVKTKTVTYRIKGKEVQGIGLGRWTEMAQRDGDLFFFEVEPVPRLLVQDIARLGRCIDNVPPDIPAGYDERMVFWDRQNLREVWTSAKRPPSSTDEPKPPTGFIPGVKPVERGKTKRSNGNGHRYLQRGCDVCPMQEHWPSLKSPRMPLRGTPDADILIIGEAPGREEDQQGRPFVGPSGKLLQSLLPADQERRIAMTNILRCRPPGNATPRAAEVHACSVHLETDIAKGRFRAILGLGAPALHHFIPDIRIGHIHGRKFVVAIGDRLLWFYPTYHPAYVLHEQTDRGVEPSALPILTNDIARFFAEVDLWPDPVIECPDPKEVICAYTKDEARRWVGEMLDPRRQGPIGLDIETNGLRPNAKEPLIMTAALSDGTMAVAWPIDHPEHPTNWGMQLLLDVARDHRWVAHNAGFELAWLREQAKLHGIDWEPKAGFDDSMAAARLHHDRDTGLGLGMLTRLYCGIDIKTLTKIDTKTINRQPLAEVLPYNGIDAWGCWRIFDEIAPQVDADNYRALLDSTASTTAMQLVGLDIDRQAAYQLREHWEGRERAAAALAQTLPEVRRYVDERQREFILSSSEQVGEVLVSYAKVALPRTGKDWAYKTDDATLTALAPEHPLALAALEYRHAHKMNETYIEPLIQAPTKTEDGRIHPSYSTLLTRTYRLSAEDPSIQNWPRRKDREVRRPIVPPQGCVWASADFGQLEARVYAMASRDRALVKSTIEREDIHSYWLDRVLQRYPRYTERLIHLTGSDNRKAWRDSIKADLVFSSFYGSTPKNVSDRTGIPYDIAMDLLGEFWDRYSGAAAWLKQQRQLYRDHGLTRDLFGRVRYGVLTGNEPVNTPIQGSAARLVLDAQNELYQLSKEDKDPYLMARINIHDDLTFALPSDPEVIEAYIDVISEILVKVRYNFQIVPLMVEWKIGDNWADLDPVHEHTGDYVK